MKAKILIILFLLLYSPSAGLCLDVQVTVDKDTITMEDFISCHIAVEGGDADIDVSAIRDFKVHSLGTSTNVSIINGKYDKKTVYQYRLFPLRIGDLLIPSINVKVGKEIIRTREINIKVSKQVPEKSLQQDIFAKASISREQLYVGQQAFYNFKLYTSLQFARATLSEPSFAGFQAKEAGERKNYSTRMNGRVFNVSEVNYVLIPQKEGPFEIEPAVVSAEVVIKGKQESFNSFFNDSFFSSSRTRPVRVASQSLKGSVSSLPPYAGANEYSGLVGVFDIQAIIDKSMLKTGESATLTIKISGTGNIMDSAAPQMAMDETNFKIYDDIPSEDITITPEGYSGFKEFKKALVPSAPGNFIIPAVSLTYFDLNQQQYKTVSTQAIQLMVDASEAYQAEIKTVKTDPLLPLQKKDVQFEQKDILTIKENMDAIHSHSPISPPLFLMGLLLPGVLFFCFRGILYVRRKDLTCSEIMERRAMINLKKAASAEQGTSEFLSFLYTALISKVLAKGNVQSESLTTQEASDILSRAGHLPEEIQQVTEIIDTIESAKFGGGGSDSSRADLLQKTSRLIKMLSVMLCVGIFYIISPVQVKADDTAMIFLEGIKSYHAGEYETAAGQFEKIAKTGIKNGHLYYNIGNAYLKANDTGRAILWYERAVKLIPNDPDLIFNLEYANTLITDKKEASVLNVTDVMFFWMNFLPLNGIQIAAVIWSCLFFLFSCMQTIRKKKIFKTTGTILGVIFLLLSFSALFDYYRQTSGTHAVVTAQHIAVRSGLSADSTKLFELHAGTKVEVEEETLTHLKIIFSNGKIGWVSQEEVQVI